MTRIPFRLDRHDEPEPDPIDYRTATRDQHDAELRRLGVLPRGVGGVRLGHRNVGEASDPVRQATGHDTVQSNRRS